MPMFTCFNLLKCITSEVVILILIFFKSYICVSTHLLCLTLPVNYLDERTETKWLGQYLRGCEELFDYTEASLC